MAFLFRYVSDLFFCVVNIWVLMFKKQKLHTAILSALAASTVAAPAAFAEIEEVVVTATKRAASTQDIPVAVQALDESTLDDFNINNFSDYLIQLPGITAGGSGPGQNTIYIRGVASTTPNLTTAGVAGIAPNVALYLDEQPLSQPGRNLDVYTADMARVEVLSGPQGTLFGASSQAGTVRLITNKPDPSGQYANVKIGTEFTKDGEMSNNVEGMVNLPINDQLTVRGVVYVDKQRVNGPAVNPPMEKGGVHGEARRLRGPALDPLRGRRGKMQERLRHPKKQQSNTNAGAKQHGKPREAAVLRLRVIGAKANSAKAGKGEVEHKEKENRDAQHVEPAKGVDDPALDGAEHLRGEGWHRCAEGRDGHDETCRHPKNHGVHHYLGRFLALPRLGAVHHYSAPAA